MKQDKEVRYQENMYKQTKYINNDRYYKYPATYYNIHVGTEWELDVR